MYAFWRNYLTTVVRDLLGTGNKILSKGKMVPRGHYFWVDRVMRACMLMSASHPPQTI